ncbi:4'-phosphopantetheinyl transferase family protein [Cohnella endophytica]|nr:4'-phosphopantetheinyl transferase superfamily protein [Cohnella endophytica]
MKIVATSIEDCEIDIEKLLTFVSIERQEKTIKLRNRQDRILSIFSELMVRYYLLRLWGLLIEDIVILKNNYNKPFLPEFPAYHFNVSHSGKWIVAVFDDRPVGIDIERVVPIDITIVDHFLSKSEVEKLRDQPADQMLVYFYKLWTVKESYIKAKGMGLSISLNSFSVEITNSVVLFHSLTDAEDWRFRQYFIGNDYEMAVCSLNSKFPDSIEIIKWKQLLEH